MNPFLVQGKDQGINVRQRSKELMELIQNDERLREERKKSKKNRDKYVGVSSEGNFLFLLCFFAVSLSTKIRPPLSDVIISTTSGLRLTGSELSKSSR